jgi:hypothetical protein
MDAKRARLIGKWSLYLTICGLIALWADLLFQFFPPRCVYGSTFRITAYIAEAGGGLGLILSVIGIVKKDRLAWLAPSALFAFCVVRVCLFPPFVDYYSWYQQDPQEAQTIVLQHLTDELHWDPATVHKMLDDGSLRCTATPGKNGIVELELTWDASKPTLRATGGKDPNFCTFWEIADGNVLSRV